MQTVVVARPVWRGLRQPIFRTRDWLRASIPLGLGATCFILMERTDVILLGALEGGKTTGVYFAASRIATLVSLPLGATASVLAPQISRAFAREDLAT